jgi:hypothetical protein
VHTLELEIEQIQDEIKHLDAQAGAGQAGAGEPGQAQLRHRFCDGLAVGEMTIEQQLSLFGGLRVRLKN